MRTTYPFWFFAFVLIVFHLFGFTGHYGFDDLYYAKLARQLQEGVIDLHDHYAYRLTTLAYLALCFKLFGTGDAAASFSAISISVATLWFTCQLVKKQATIIVFFTLSVQVMASWYLFYTDKITPDIYVLLFATAAVYFVTRQRFESSSGRSVRYATGLAVAVVLGFLSKETILMLMPALLVFAIVDLLYKRNVLFWLLSMGFGLMLLLLYFYIIYRLTGNAFARYSAIQSNAYYNACSYDVQPFIFTLRRIGYQFIELFVQTGLALPLAFLGSGLAKHKREAWRLNSEAGFYLVLSVVLLLTGNFMSTSIKAYNPICLDIRHFLWMMPPLAVVAGLALKHYLDETESDFSIARWLILLCIISYAVGSAFTFTVYLPFTLVWVWHGFYRHSRAARYFVPLLFITLLQPLFHWITYAHEVGYEQQKQTVMQVLKEHPADTFITDEVQKRLIAFYTDDDSIENGRVLTFDRIADENYTGKLVYSNWYTQYLSGMAEEAKPLWLRLKNEGRQQMVHDTILHIDAFRINKPLRATTVLMKQFNYEAPPPQLRYDASRLIRDATGVYERTGEYSATFEMGLDSLPFDGRQLIIMAEAVCKMENNAEAKLVIDISSNNAPLKWKGEDCNGSMKAYGLWWPVKNEIMIDKADLEGAHATLKIYIWVPARAAFFIRSWKIEMISTGQ